MTVADLLKPDTQLDPLPPPNRAERRRGAQPWTCGTLSAERQHDSEERLQMLAERAVSSKVSQPRKPRRKAAVEKPAETPELSELTGDLRTIGGANTLQIYGWGGGYGPDGAPFTSTSPDFQYNMARLARDVGGAGAVLRMNCTALYSQASDSWGSWNFPVIDAAVAIADHVGCQILLSVNVRSPTSSDKVPKVDSTGHMSSWAAQWPKILDRYCGTGATIKSTSTVTVNWAGGGSTTYTISGAWPGVLYVEVWNEPNSIGKCGGALALGGSNQNLKWYDLVWRLNREALTACQAHKSWGQFKLSAITMGGLHTDYLIGTAANPGVILFGKNQGFSWNGFHAVSMHCYMIQDPLVSGVDSGGTGPSGGAPGVLDTIRTAIRPGLNSNNADQCLIWITEGGHGGCLSPSTGVEQWSEHNVTAGGHTPTNSNSSKATSTGDCSWGHMYGDPGMNAAQQSGHNSHPRMMRNYIKKIRNMNANNGAGIEMFTQHMLIRPVKLEGQMGDFPAGSGTSGTALIVDDATQGGQGNLYWQIARCLSELIGSATNRNLYHDKSTASGVATISIASPAVVSQASHGLAAGDVVRFTTTGALPTGLVASATYYVLAAGLTSGAFRVSLTPGGAAINTTGTQSGTHTLAPGSPDWLPAANHYYDERTNAAAAPPAAPVNITLPSLLNTTPKVGDVIGLDPGTWSGNPSPVASYQWKLNGTAVPGETAATYTVKSGDVGKTVSCTVKMTNSQGNASATTAASTAVAANSGGAPQNTTLPYMTDSQGVLTTQASGGPAPGGAAGLPNPPNQGVQVTLNAGAWSPGATSYLYAWEKSTDGGATWTTI